MNTVCYAAKCKENIKKSSSGGIFYAISKWVINNAGVVVGAAFDDDYRVEHIIVDSIEGIEKIQGSKYVQSVLGDCYSDVANLLQEGKLVLFSGTPCQVNGLYSFLKATKVEFERLITIEILCHGVPSPAIFYDYIHKYIDREKNLSAYSFRTKDKNKQFQIKLTFKEKKVSYRNALLDPYYSGFLANMTLRPCCYECTFSGSKREADFTIGDFWGVEKVNVEYKDINNSSVVLVNSEKGRNVFDSIKSILFYSKVSIDDATAKQVQLKNTPKYSLVVPCLRNEVFLKWKTLESDAFFKYLASVSINKKKVLFNMVPEKLKRIIKRYI